MAKKKRSRTSSFLLGNQNNKGELPTKEEIDTTILKVAAIEKATSEKAKKIPFTTALTPHHRALLETASHQSKIAIADLLKEALDFYFDEKRPTQSEEMYAIFLKIYESKAK